MFLYSIIIYLFVPLCKSALCNLYADGAAASLDRVGRI